MDNYATRPLGVLMNVQIFSRFWPHLDVVALLISLLVLAVAALFCQVARKEFRLPMWGLLVGLLWWPVAVEGQYWLGAATLIVPGMLFLALGMYFIAAYRDEAVASRRRVFWILGFTFTLASFLSYEQYWFCGLGALLAMAWRGRNRRWQSAAAGFAAMASTALWYLGLGALHSVPARKPPDSISAILSNVHEIGGQLADIWGPVTWQAFARPPMISRSDFPLLLVILLMAICAVWLMGKEYKQYKYIQSINPRKIVCVLGAGFVWIVLSFAPWLITSYQYISLRSVFIAAPGIGLMIEGFVCLAVFLFNMMIRAAALKKCLSAISMAVLSAALCCLVLIHVSEVRSYVAAGRFDMQVGQKIAGALEKWGYTEEPVALRHDHYVFLPGGFFYHEHIMSSWSSGWAGADALSGLSHGRLQNPVEIIRSDEKIGSLARDEKEERAWVIITDNDKCTSMQKKFNLSPCVVIRYRAKGPELEVVDSQIYE
jgi:MFS family permease